jgi:DNA replication protein DnaC
MSQRAKPADHGPEQAPVNDSPEPQTEARVRKHLDTLDLPCLRDSLDDVLAWARKQRPGALALIERAVAADAELVLTRSIEGRLRTSGLPERPTLETFDFDFQPSIDKALVMQLAELDFIRAHEDVVLTGNSGTGKSHIVKAIAVRACSAGIKVLYRRFHVLMDDLYAGLADNTYDKRLRRYARAPVLVIDDVGLGRIRRSADEPTAAQMFFTLADKRVGHTSTLMTSNIKLSAWGGYLGDPALTMAVLDRMIQRATRMEIEGPSWRDKESKELNERRRSDAHKRKPGAAARTAHPPAR